MGRQQVYVATTEQVWAIRDLRHYLASLLIASGADIKTVQAQCGTSAPARPIDTYGQLWPDADESTRSAIGAVIAKRMDSVGASAGGPRTTVT